MSHDPAETTTAERIEALLAADVEAAEERLADLRIEIGSASSLHPREFFGEKSDILARLDDAYVAAMTDLAIARAEYQRITGYEFGFEPEPDLF